ncbi:glycine--tRNA ligase [archaeon SCG-AAA382B04]|nr:glycine--tRNA ligase [archaeon SCG-AAA382B04]
MSDTYKDLMDISKRRGFIWPSFEIHGSASGFYDYGPLGKKLLDNIKEKWKNYYIQKEGFEEVKSTTIMSKPVFEASGHLSGFEDALTQCKECNNSFRADHLIEEHIEVEPDSLSNKKIEQKIENHNVRCPECGGTLGEVYSFNLMFKTNIGPGKGRAAYLRPETAQGIFVNFNYLYKYNRKSLPFGVVQTGRAYRNEISPRKGVIRMREFQQMEAEVFVEPNEKNHPNFSKVEKEELRLFPIKNQKEDKGYINISTKKAVEKNIIGSEILAYYLAFSKRILKDIGLNIQKIRFRQHLPEERAHYASDCWDIEGETDRFGWIELAGISDRGDYDLKKHAEKSGESLTAFKEFEEPKKLEKWVIEPNMDVLGPKHKQKADIIAEKLKEQDPQKIKKELENNSFILELDEETVEINSEEVNIQKTTKTIKGENIFPHIIEPSFGIDRILYLLMEHSYKKDKLGEGQRSYFNFKPEISPIDLAVFPLMKEEELKLEAEKIYEELNKEYEVVYDENGSIGKRYRRQDEIGTPYCITIDYETLEDDSVTIRQLTSGKQKRVEYKELKSTINDLFSNKKNFKDLK